MAQHFEIPMVFEFTPKKFRWQRTGFEIAGWRTELFPPKPYQFMGINMPAIGPTLLTPDDLLVSFSTSLKQPRGRDSLEDALFMAYPPELAAHFEAVAELNKDDLPIGERLAEVFVSFDHDAPEEKARDAWAMRTELMRLPETNEALLRFLNRWGVWNYGKLTPHSSRFKLADFQKIDEKTWLECTSPSLVWRDRARLRAGMLERPEIWLSNNAALGFGANRRRFPFLGVKANTCLRAVEITITLDHLRSVKSRICARPDCDNIFTVESNHGKRYCDQYCAHLVSVRKNRAAAKKAKTVGQRRKR